MWIWTLFVFWCSCYQRSFAENVMNDSTDVTTSTDTFTGWVTTRNPTLYDMQVTNTFHPSPEEFEDRITTKPSVTVTTQDERSDLHQTTLRSEEENTVNLSDVWRLLLMPVHHDAPQESQRFQGIESRRFQPIASSRHPDSGSGSHTASFVRQTSPSPDVVHRYPHQPQSNLVPERRPTTESISAHAHGDFTSRVVRLHLQESTGMRNPLFLPAYRTIQSSETHLQRPPPTSSSTIRRIIPITGTNMFHHTYVGTEHGLQGSQRIATPLPDTERTFEDHTLPLTDALQPEPIVSNELNYPLPFQILGIPPDTLPSLGFPGSLPDAPRDLIPLTREAVDGGNSPHIAIGSLHPFPHLEPVDPSHFPDEGGQPAQLDKLPPAVEERDEYQAASNPYEFGYEMHDGNGTEQHRIEKSDRAGVVTGSYGYRDSYGVYRIVNYIADKDGYRAFVKTNEPGVASQVSPGVVVEAEHTPPGLLPDGSRGIRSPHVSSESSSRTISDSSESD